MKFMNHNVLRDLSQKLISLAIIICMLIILIPVVPSTAYAVSYDKPTGYYLVKNLESGKYLNVVGNSSSSKTNVTVYSKDGTSGQLFKLATDSSGWTTLTSVCAPNCRLNVNGSKSTNGANVNIYTETGHSTQGWYLENISGSYIIRSANKTDIVLTEAGTKNSSNVLISTYSKGKKSQIWALESYTPIISLSSSNGTTTISSSISITVTTAPTYSSVSVSSKDTSIASCHLSTSITDKNGKATLKITGKQKGKTTITVKANGKAKTFEISVTAEPPSPNTNSLITTKMINSALKHYGLDVSKVGLNHLSYSKSEYYWKYINKADEKSYIINKFSSIENASKKIGYSFYGVQCFGFANLLGNKMTGKVPTKSWTKYNIKSLNAAGGLKVGDVVRFELDGDHGHSAMVYSISSSGKILWVECLGGSANRVDITGFNGNDADYGFMNKLNNWKNEGLVSTTIIDNRKFAYVRRYTGSK